MLTGDKLARATDGSIIHNIAETPRMATEILPTNLADVVRVVLVVPEDPVELAAQAALVVSESLAVPVALVVPAVRVALVVSENAAVLVALVVPAVRVALVVSENPAAPVALERELVQVEAGLVQGHRPAQLAVALRTKSVIAAHHLDQVPLLAVEEDLAAAVAETTRVPAAAEAAVAWEVADIVAAEAAVAAAVE